MGVDINSMSHYGQQAYVHGVKRKELEILTPHAREKTERENLQVTLYRETRIHNAFCIERIL